MTRHPLGRHLHSQLVLPLAIAAVIVAIGATFVAVNVIGGIVEDWIDRNADDAASLVVSRIERRAQVLRSSLGLISSDPRVIEAISHDDYAALRERLAFAGRALGTDTLMLLDGDGRVVLSVGGLALPEGERPFGASAAEAATDAELGPLLAMTGGDYAIGTAAALRGHDGRVWALAAVNAVDESLMADLGLGVPAGIALLDASGLPVAAAVPESFGTGDLFAAIAPDAYADTVAAPDISADAGPTGVGITTDGVDYRGVARPLVFGNSESTFSGYLMAVVDTESARDAERTTTILITMWLVLGLMSLLGLNWYVARKATRPLALLSESVARVAAGDFSARVEVSGANEIGDLAEDFNRMTDSLKERSDSLTKKVLELATLYEMSRSLGSTLELETLLDSVLDSAMRIFDVEVGYVTMVDRESGALEVATWRGVDLSKADAVTVRASMSDWVIREGRPLIFNPPPDGAPASEDAHGDSISGAVAALCVPLLSSEGTIGAITVGTRDSSLRFTSDDVRLLATIANHVTIAVGNIALFSSVQEAYLATVRALAAAVDAKDPYTRGHSDGVANYALLIGEAMVLSPEQMVALEMAAYLHDIGKIGISEDILLKPGKLTDAEMSQMRHHPLIGANILKPVAFPWPIAPIVRHHHEHYDGNGYPAGLRAEEIPVLARVLTVADAFEAMVADRPYRRGRSQQEAILELRRCAGTQFDRRVVDAFVGVLEGMDADVTDALAGDDDIDPVEEQAVLVALCDGMFASFRRLGGPRLATNLERSVNERLAERSVPFSLHGGHLGAADDESVSDEAAVIESLAVAIRIMSDCIETASGAGLADHFLAEALGTLPERMRTCAARLGFTPAT